jgi:predicted DCC family thiol-disulfide oxidoreductase YuxK
VSLNPARSGPLLVYDGDCVLCNRAMRLVLKRDRSRTSRFAPLHGETAAAVLAAHPELRGIDSMIWLDENGRAFTRSAAALAIARHLGGGWAVLGTLARIVPGSLRDALYDAIARARYRVFGRYDACPVPLPEDRARFLP